MIRAFKDIMAIRNVITTMAKLAKMVLMNLTIILVKIMLIPVNGV